MNVIIYSDNDSKNNIEEILMMSGDYMVRRFSVNDIQNYKEVNPSVMIFEVIRWSMYSSIFILSPSFSIAKLNFSNSNFSNISLTLLSFADCFAFVIIPLLPNTK